MNHANIKIADWSFVRLDDNRWMASHELWGKALLSLEGGEIARLLASDDDDGWASSQLFREIELRRLAEAAALVELVLS